MSLEAPRRLALPNDLVLIPITLNNAANVANLNFDLQYNAAVIRPEGNYIPGNLFGNGLFPAIPRSPASSATASRRQAACPSPAPAPSSIFVFALSGNPATNHRWL